MQTMRSSDPAVVAVIGYAADERGRGVAYTRVGGPGAKELLRIVFAVSEGKRSAERAIAYTAVTAVARVLAKRGVRAASFVLSDAEFVDEIATGRGVGEKLAIPYVRLRCALNSLAKFSVRVGATDDLTQRARAEVALNVAA